MTRPLYRVAASVTERPVLFLWTEEGAELDPVQRLLIDAGARHVSHTDEGAALLSSEPIAIVTLIYSDPCVAIARNLVSDPSVDAIEAWKATAESVLTRFRSNRRRFLLINREAALSDLTLFAKELNHRLGSEFLDVTDELSDASSPAPTPELLALAVASACIRWSESSTRLAAELQASSLPLPMPTLAAPASFIASWRARGEWAADNQHEQLEEANELLYLQLAQAREELEHYYRANGELEGRMSGFDRLIEESQCIREELQESRSTLEALRKSLSWKLTAPIRAVLAPVMGKSPL